MSFVVKAVKSVVKAVVGVVTGVVKAIGSVVSAVINFVASPFMGLFGVPDMPSDTSESSRQQGILVQQQGSNVDIPVVYGYRKLAGAVVYVETGSTNNQYLWVAYVFAEGLVEGLREVFIDDNQLPNTIVADLNAGKIVNITEGKYNGRVRMQWYPGVLFSNPADTTIAANSILKEAPSWKTTNHFNGLAVLFARYEWKQIVTQADSDNNPFGGGIPAVQVGLLGKRIASLTISNPDSYSYANAPVRYSTNPAEIVLDYLRNPNYGKGLSNTEIDWDSFTKAAAKCNQTVEYIAGVSGPILTTNYVVDTGQTIFNNVKVLLTNMRGYLPYVQGKYKLRIEDAGNDTDILSGSASIAATFTKDNIVGDITYTGIERSAKYSQVVVSYVDPDQKWSVQQVVYPETEAERITFVTRDGGRENKAEITFPGCTNYAIAKDFAKLIFNKSRYQESCSFRADSSAFKLEPGDNVYIAANVLNFGTDPNAGAIPWRIVSIKLNNDYTFDIGCVRNPDFLYPHVRVGEIDQINPTYVPKGAEIYYPTNPTGVPVGLVPPTNAVLPATGSTNTTTNPTTTNPTTDGGGNGGTTNNTTTNTSPAPAPTTTATLNHVIKLDKASYVVENGQIYALLEFTQPDSSLYSGVIFYYKRNIASETVWKLYESNDVPGIGQKITAKIGPLIAATYSLKTRVKYSTQQQSTLAGTFSLNVVANTNENPTDYAETIGSGWTPNTTPLPNSRDTIVREMTAATILSGGQPTNPRTLSVTVTQDILNKPINGYVDGMKIYYKSSAATYWKESSVQFAQPYNEGTAQTFTLPFGLGVPSYPTTPGTADNYDFIFRFKYNDGTESTLQYRILDVNVEYSAFGTYNFNPFSEKIPLPQEKVTDFVFVTETNAPPGSVADPRDMTIGVTAISNSTSLPAKIIFAITPPNAANLPNWYGVRIYSRPVIEGTNPAFTSTDIIPVPSDATGRYLSLAINYDEIREYVLVPVVDYSGTKTEAKQAWYGRGYVHNRTSSTDYPSTGNWLSTFNLQLLDTNVALSNISSAFPQTDPTIMVQSWTRVQQDNTGTDQTKTYYELVFSHQHITNYNLIEIYRRSYIAPNVSSIGTGTTSSLYYGMGQWEKVTVTTTAPTGTVTVNLRSSIGYAEFDPYYNVPGYTGRTLVNSLYTTNKPLAPSFSSGSYDEFIVVVKSNGNYSAKALRLPPITATPLSSRVNGIAVNKPTTVTVADYNTTTVGYLRRLTESRSSIANANLLANSSRTAGYTPPTPSTGPSVV